MNCTHSVLSHLQVYLDCSINPSTEYYEKGTQQKYYRYYHPEFFGATEVTFLLVFDSFPSSFFLLVLTGF